MAARFTRAVPALLVLLSCVAPAHAQPLGTFRWQLQPFCNAVLVNVTQTGAVYTVDGYDDQCGAAQRAPLVGLATPNPDGSIGFGLHVVTVPGGLGLQIDARIALTTLSGTWRDSEGYSGTFAFDAANAGAPRPAVKPPVPSTFALRSDGGFLAVGMPGTGEIPTANSGTRMMWYPGKAAFRAGTVSFTQWNDGNVGSASTAFGLDTVAKGGASFAVGTSTTASGGTSFAAGDETTASGVASMAVGINTTASGSVSTAIGHSATASGPVSAAFGFGTVASGDSSTAFGAGAEASGSVSMAAGRLTRAVGAQSVALGLETTANAHHAFAMGHGSQANGDNSVAMGAGARANGFEAIALGLSTTTLATGGVAIGSNATAAGGSFAFGDRSTNNVLSTAVANQFAARTAGGAVFYTNAAMSAGVALAGGGSSWAPLSDANAKENFRAISGEEVLAKLAAMSIQEWNYKAQDASIRHVGPTAQDFRAAFGVGDFPLRINTVDADGIALVAIQALERRTRTLDERNARLEHENQELRDRLARLEARER